MKRLLAPHSGLALGWRFNYRWERKAQDGFSPFQLQAMFPDLLLI
jgi:hypothetical protein